MKFHDMCLKERLFVIVLLALAFLALFFLNTLTAIQRDDLSYSFNFVTKERISSLHDIFQSLRTHYTQVNGRLPVHFFAHLFLWIGKPFFNVINTLSFSGLILLICFHAFGTFHNFRVYSPLVFFLGLYAMTPAFGESFLWVTGAANYLYGILLILLFLFPFRHLYSLEYYENTWWKLVVFLFTGIIAGWTNENTSCAMIVFLVCMILWALKSKKQLPLWFYSGLLGCVIGFLLMVLAPGEITRLNQNGGMADFHILLRRTVSVTFFLVRHFWPIIIIWVFLFIQTLQKHTSIEQLFLPLSFLLAGLAASYSMIFSPMIPNRIWSGPLIFFLISLGSLWQICGKPTINKTPLRIAIVAIISVVLMFNYGIAIHTLEQTSQAYSKREAYAAEEIKNGETILKLDPVFGSSSRFDAADITGDLTSDPTNWLNVALARYLGAKSVVMR